MTKSIDGLVQHIPLALATTYRKAELTFSAGSLAILCVIYRIDLKKRLKMYYILLL